jgi:kynureninase
MEATFKPIVGSDSYRLSNPCVLAVVSVLGSLQVFAKTSMDQLRQKSLLLTGFLESQLKEVQAKHPVFKIITPSDPQQRGCQLSILFDSSEMMERVYHGLMERGCICDDRKPNVIRIAPTPLYNSFVDVYACVQMIESLL